MRKTIVVAGAALVLAIAALVTVPAQVELTVGSVEGGDAVFSGWIGSDGEIPTSLEGQLAPWETQLIAKGLTGFIEAAGDRPLRVRARMFKGPLTVSELNLVGTQITLMNRAGLFSGRAR